MTAHAVDRITGARGPHGPMELFLADGRVADSLPAGERAGADPGVTLDVAGAVVLPAFVDAHVHLDKAHLYGAAGTVPAAADVASAIESMAEIRRTQPPHTVADGARHGVEALVANGVVAARAHVEVDPGLGLELLDLHLALREENADRLDLQLSVFPQNGIDGDVAALMASALDLGAEVVGGCPYVDNDQESHLDTVFGLAERYGRPVDLHLDFDDEPSGSMIEAVANRTRAHGMQHRVTIGHVTKLAAMSPDEQARSFAMMAEAGIALVVMPATDLYLAGAGEPGTRSLAPIERAARLGVRVAISNNNLYNAFSPYGNGSLLTAAWTAGLIRRMVGQEAHDILFRAITTNPAQILGRAPHGTTPGQSADLVVLDTDDPIDVVLHDPPVLASMRRGRLVHQQRQLRLRTLERTMG